MNITCKLFERISRSVAWDDYLLVVGEPRAPGADAAAGEVGVAALPRPPALVARRHVGEHAEHGVADLVSLGILRLYWQLGHTAMQYV